SAVDSRSWSLHARPLREQRASSGLVFAPHDGLWSGANSRSHQRRRPAATSGRKRVGRKKRVRRKGESQTARFVHILRPILVLIYKTVTGLVVALKLLLEVTKGNARIPSHA